MKTRSTKKALLCSLLSLVVCISMLVGSTFAWFTDSVSSLNNIIKSGNLDVELEYSTDMSNWTAVTSDTKLFDEKALWEPGYTQVVYLKVSNKGSLALKYSLGVNVYEETPGVNQEGDSFKLSDYIYYGVEEDVTAKYADRAAAVAAVKDGSEKLSVAYTKAGSLLAKAESAQEYPSDVVAMVVYMPETVGNVANHNGTDVPVIKLGVNLVATQYTYESDSFGTDYDALAEFVPAWDGTVGKVPAETDGKITISTAAELAAFAQSVNDGTSYSGKKVFLANDINLGDNEWTPIGSCDSAAYFQGTFDGQGNTVYNMTVDNSDDAYKFSTSGFFGWIDAASATIKNLKFANANVKGSHWVGSVAGYMTGTVENCEVTDSTVIGNYVNDDADGDKVGGLVGCLNTGSTLKNNTVANCTIGGNRDIGGLVGSVATGDTVTNNTVSDTTITYITEKTYASAGEIVSGRTGFVADSTNVAENVVIYKGELVAAGVVKTANNSYDVISKEGLLNVNDIIAASSTGEGRGIKVKLLSDIDLAGETWKPIDKMWIDFDGNGHTVSNLTTEAWKAGFFGYVGGGSIKNLTLENVKVTGSQAGAFAGSIEGTIDNCVLKGDNVITYAEKHQYDDPSKDIEAWGGIGAISGITQPCTVNATIAEGATVTLDYNGIETEAAYVDEYTGYIGTNKGTVVNNGEIFIGISSVAGLTQLAETVNAYSNYEHPYEGETVKLLNDIDLGGAEWTPIGDYRFSANRFCGTFDGQEHTISNFKITKKTDKADDNKSSYGFFGNVEGTIKNLTIDNATVSSYAYVGALVGRMNGGAQVINCHVQNSSVESSYWQAGGMIGQQNGSGLISGCTVTNTTVTGASAIGGLVGPVTLDKADQTLTIEKCSVKDSAVVQKGSFGASYDALFGAMCNDIDVADASVVNINECSVENTTVKGVASSALYSGVSGIVYVDGVKQ